VFSGGLQGVVNQWKEADNFGSLIRPLVTDVSEVLKLLSERQMGEDLFLASVHQKVLKALRQAEYLSPKYHVVVANPPYMSHKGMNVDLRGFAVSEFPQTKADLFAMFVERIIDQTIDRGFVGLMTPFTWMFLSSYTALRQTLLEDCTITSLVRPEYHAFFDSAFVPVCAFTFRKVQWANYEGVFIDLQAFYGSNIQASRAREAIHDASCSWRFSASSEEFQKVPGKPIAFTISPEFREVFSRGTPLHELSEPKSGLNTTDNQTFLRQWYEVGYQRVGFGFENVGPTQIAKYRWYPFCKGGDFRRWYGNIEYVVNWEQNGRDIRNATKGAAGGRIVSPEYYFRQGITWSGISSGKPSMRVMRNAIFGSGGKGLFSDQYQDFFLALLNSHFVARCLQVLSPTLNYETGHVGNIPVMIPESSVLDLVGDLVNDVVEVARKDWDSRELSIDFTSSELVGPLCSPIRLEDRYAKQRSRWQDQTQLVANLERQLNKTVNELYSLSNELPSSPAVAEISLNCNPQYRYDDDKSESELEALLLADTMREFIGYAVGCMLGRYSLDKPGLILANQGETADDYRLQIPEPTFACDEDNVIPLLDGNWFEDDITERLKTFLKVTFGTEHYEENLKFLEDAVYPDNLTVKKRKTIRDYFLKDFYSHHIKLYKKRPIYWLFSSPKGTFNALIYMHRYRPDTVGTVLHYLRDFRDKLTHHAEHQQMLADSASASKSEKTQAIKDVAAIKKQLKELEDYEKPLFEVAARKIDIDLDDGVKHNYLLFGSVLRKIPGLDAKEEE
jgi:hypothetical protein